MNILLIFGTRPEAIKLAPVILELRNYSYINTFVCVTGQHKEMLKIALDDFGILPDFNLNIMEPNQSLSSLSSKLIGLIDPIIKEIKPDWILVHGDTTSAFVGALSGFYNFIPVAHIEAGLRTYDISSPFPEELNRQMIARIAKINFCPTFNNSQNLLKEGILKENIIITGNTVVDSVLWMKKKFTDQPLFSRFIYSNICSLVNFNIENSKYVLITGHRRENFGSGFQSICNAIKKLALIYPDLYFVYPVHMNPNVKNIVNELLSNISNIRLIEPVNYPEFVALLSNCLLVLTDSGGIQEEAPIFKKPVLIIRNNTERSESLRSGLSLLVGTNENSICNGVINVINTDAKLFDFKNSSTLYGDGNAAKIILKFLTKT
jgi:UDP-N-acetylglucosamine 2-epimerase (non-hydrolysing)